MASRNLGKQFDRRPDVVKAMDDGGQLVMFATGGELMNAVHPLDDDREELDDGLNYRLEDDDEFWDRKTEEADQYGLIDSVDEIGVQRPVRLTKNRATVMNGHHRIAAAAEAENRRYGTSRQGPAWVPLSWEESGGVAGSGKDDEYEKDGLPHQRDLY